MIIILYYISIRANARACIVYKHIYRYIHTLYNMRLKATRLNGDISGGTLWYNGSISSSSSSSSPPRPQLISFECLSNHRIKDAWRTRYASAAETHTRAHPLYTLYRAGPACVHATYDIVRIQIYAAVFDSPVGLTINV